jgi:hypothetical protein
MIESGTNRLEILTMSLEEMWEYCHRTGIEIPIAHRPIAMSNQAAAAVVVLARNAHPSDDDVVVNWRD